MHEDYCLTQVLMCQVRHQHCDQTENLKCFTLPCFLPVKFSSRLKYFTALQHLFLLLLFTNKITRLTGRLSDEIFLLLLLLFLTESRLTKMNKPTTPSKTRLIKKLTTSKSTMSTVSSSLYSGVASAERAIQNPG